jgi:hypothetical protein
MNIVGCRELLHFTDLGLINILAKIDTGAYTSSIHVNSCKVKHTEIGDQLAVVFLDETHPQFNGHEVLFPSFRLKKVKSSTGQEQLRYFVNGTIVLGEVTYTTEFSLTQRNGMRNPILLGRKLLNKRFFVDSSKKYITRNANEI